MKDLLEKAKKLLPLFIKYKRYFAVCGLFVAMVAILYFFTGEEYVAKRLAEINSRTVSGEDYVPDKEFEINAYEEVNELIATYFDAYVNVDFETLDMVAQPVSEMEKSYIAVMSQYYEEYQNITCYTKHGLSKDSYIVAARFDIKFVDYDVTAPNLLVFYVQTNKDGELYINNLYSNFNIKYKESDVNTDVNIALNKFIAQKDYIVMRSEVESEYQQLIKGNEEIYQLVERTIPIMRQEWEDTVYYAHNEDTEATESTEDTENTESTQNTEATEVIVDTEDDTQQSATEPSTEVDTQVSTEPQVIYVRATADGVNVRAIASTEGDSLGKVEEGDVFKKVGVEGDWTKIDYNGKTGYIKSSYLDEVTE